MDWCWSASGFKHNNWKENKNDDDAYGKKWKEKDLVKVEVDRTSGTLRYFLNVDDQGKAFQDERLK